MDPIAKIREGESFYFQNAQHMGDAVLYLSRGEQQQWQNQRDWMAQSGALSNMVSTTGQLSIIPVGGIQDQAMKAGAKHGEAWTQLPCGHAVRANRVGKYCPECGKLAEPRSIFSKGITWLEILLFLPGLLLYAGLGWLYYRFFG